MRLNIGFFTFRFLGCFFPHVSIDNIFSFLSIFFFLSLTKLCSGFLELLLWSVSPQNSSVGNLTPKDEAIRRWDPWDVVRS